MSDSNEQAGFVAPDPADLAPLFPGYEIQGLIATGGMGAVYCAVQKSLDRAVALKILPRELSKDAAFCAGFEAEAKAMARLNHPNLIGVYDFGEVNGMLYIIMEYVPGKSIYHSAYGKSIDQKEVIRLVTGVCNGLAHAHENGIIHRDIKPSNILLDLNAEPKIGDFGLARPIENKVQEGEEIFGTPHYTAPEVVNSPHSVDYRADIFSVGVLLHELLTGRLPAEDPRPASTMVHCDSRFDTIIRRATQPLAAARYSSAKEIAKDLQAIASSIAPKGPPRGPVVTAHRAAHAGRSRGKFQPKKSSNSAVFVFLLAAVIAAFGAYVFYTKNPPPEPPKSTVVILPANGSKADKKSDSVVDHDETPEPEVSPGPDEKSTDPTMVKPDPVEDPVENTTPAVTPDNVPDASNLPPPKFDVPGFFERARKIMQDKAKTPVAAYQLNLKTNFTTFEASLKRQVRKYKPGAGPETDVLDTAIEGWKTDGGKVPSEIGTSLSEFMEIEAIRAEFYQKQTGVQDTFKQALSTLSGTYILGLQKQIERLKADNDAGAIDLVEKEIEATKSDPDYFSGLILGSSSGAGE
ncbi:MAG: protein kinase [Luteolibacter sp.]|uniref:serine/threonine protein kinase n=1 Tax=Luteolibacter sp. TaxID=1962973 RepID=UPI0032658E7C